MALGEVESGTQTATAEHVLGVGSSVDGVYVCKVNLDDMVNGDLVRVAIRGGTLAGDADQGEYSGYYQHLNGGLSDPNVTTPPVVVVQGTARCVVEEIGANSVSIPWALVRIGEF